jgi:hypothetical protein
MLSRTRTTILALVLFNICPITLVSGFSASQEKRTFRFASNGVCLEPQYFVDVPKHNDNNNDDDGPRQKQQQAKNNHNHHRFTMRNVPGDGDCMFLAVSLAAATSMGLGGNDALLRAISRETRSVVAQVLESPGNLHISKTRIVTAHDLLQSAAQKLGLRDDTDAYLELLRKEGNEGGLYGGGPELTVLANVLRRPISIYEIDDYFNQPENKEERTKECRIVCKGTFGDGLFEDPCATIPNSAILSGVQPGAYSWHLHILVLDVSLEEKHACVLLPETPII